MNELQARATRFTPAALPAGLPNISYVSGPTYVGPNSMNLLLPLNMNSGVLDLVLQNNFTLSTGLPQSLGALVTLSGNSNRVVSIGSNLRNYIKNQTWGSNTIPNASSISVHIPANMTMVQQLDPTFVGRNGNTGYTVTNSAPPPNYALQFTGFGVTHVFLTPLTLKAVNSSGQTFYITLFSNFDAIDPAA